MNAIQCIPLWQWFGYVAAIVVVVAAVVAIPSAYLAAKHGARLALEICSKHWGCVMRTEEERAQTTQNLEEQMRKLRMEHPEIAKTREAMKKALKDTGENQAVPSPQPPTAPRARAKKDEEGQR